ncbi:MAG: hypothetical protein ABIF71_11115 [Planctomycetota bacterium]
MNPRVIQSLVGTAVEVCENMMGLEVRPGTPLPDGQMPATAYASRMALRCDGTDCGFVALHVDAPVAATMQAGFLGGEGVPGGDIADTVNEVLNIITGRVKGILSQERPGLTFDFPKFMRNAPAGGTGTVIPFHLPGGVFFVVIDTGE